jgi:hypothetical protein
MHPVVIRRLPLVAVRSPVLGVNGLSATASTTTLVVDVAAADIAATAAPDTTL